MYYNFCRIHQTLRVTPAMAAGVTDRLWSISDIVALLDGAEERERAERKESGSYRQGAGVGLLVSTFHCVWLYAP